MINRLTIALLADLGTFELLLILGVALLLFGTRHLPKVARDAGRWVETLRRAAQRVTDELSSDEHDRPPSSDRDDAHEPPA